MKWSYYNLLGGGSAELPPEPTWKIEGECNRDHCTPEERTVIDRAKEQFHAFAEEGNEVKQHYEAIDALHRAVAAILPRKVKTEEMVKDS